MSGQQEFLKEYKIDLFSLIKHIAAVALEIETLFCDMDLNFLTTGTRASVTLTNRQILCMIAHMFFLTTDSPIGLEMNGNTFKYWIIMSELNVKLKFLFSYFQLALQETENRHITIYRCGLDKDPSDLGQLISLSGLEG